MNFFNSEKDDFSKKKHFSRKLIYLNFEGFVSMFENVFSEKWSIFELKNNMNKINGSSL